MRRLLNWTKQNRELGVGLLGIVCLLGVAFWAVRPRPQGHQVSQRQVTLTLPAGAYDVRDQGNGYRLFRLDIDGKSHQFLFTTSKTYMGSLVPTFTEVTP
jgi:hypothetical protein